VFPHRRCRHHPYLHHRSQSQKHQKQEQQRSRSQQLQLRELVTCAHCFLTLRGRTRATHATTKEVRATPRWQDSHQPKAAGQERRVRGLGLNSKAVRPRSDDLRGLCDRPFRSLAAPAQRKIISEEFGPATAPRTPVIEERGSPTRRIWKKSAPKTPRALARHPGVDEAYVRPCRASRTSVTHSG
jgi:hypothetical protein